METFFQSSFEEGSYDYQPEGAPRPVGELTCPIGWTPQWIEFDDDPPGILHRPEYDMKDKQQGHPEVHSGRFAATFNTRHATHDGCLYRKFKVGKGKGVRVRVMAMGISHEDDMVTDGGHGMRVGIDPTGGEDHTALSVVYGDWYSSYMKDKKFGAQQYKEGKWVEVSAETVSKAEEVTVFLHARADFGVDINASHWDDLVIEVGDASEIPPPKRKEIKVADLSLGQLVGLIRRTIKEEADG